MSRDLITPVEITTNAGSDAKAATAINVSNGAYIDAGAIVTGKLVIHIKNTYGGAKIVTFAAGDFIRSPLGDLEISVAATDGEKVTVIESSRFKDEDGYILINFEAAMTGLVGAYLVP